jgi:hypothetical protein
MVALTIGVTLEDFHLPFFEPTRQLEEKALPFQKCRVFSHPSSSSPYSDSLP